MKQDIMKQDIFNQIANKIKSDNQYMINSEKSNQILMATFFINRKSNGIEYEKFVQYPGYACDTLINGNKSHCIEYLQQLICSGLAGTHWAFDELLTIKNNCPDKYDYIIDNVFSL